ncbi:hypothetical protein PALB_35380 [Pseudoalteromonas luteoviolacea B = ATCC 29581]|nr:hypothetical protein PALB_35380 [Pseudoalteromonas luteoviolacea B = ATCC 29581]
MDRRLCGVIDFDKGKLLPAINVLPKRLKMLAEVTHLEID